MNKQKKKKKKPGAEDALPPKPTGRYGNFNSPMFKTNIVAKSKKVRKKI
jgi:hypothetical protein